MVEFGICDLCIHIVSVFYGGLFLLKRCKHCTAQHTLPEMIQIRYVGVEVHFSGVLMVVLLHVCFIPLVNSITCWLHYLAPPAPGPHLQYHFGLFLTTNPNIILDLDLKIWVHVNRRCFYTRVIVSHIIFVFTILLYHLVDNTYISRNERRERKRKYRYMLFRFG